MLAIYVIVAAQIEGQQRRILMDFVHFEDVICGCQHDSIAARFGQNQCLEHVDRLGNVGDGNLIKLMLVLLLKVSEGFIEKKIIPRRKLPTARR